MITWEKFLDNIEKFVALSDKLLDGWSLHRKDNNEFGIYITKRTNLWDVADNPVVTFEFHVAYNVNYSVPVLCIAAWRPDGSMLGMEECWKICRFSDFENIYTTLTQADHPVLQRPYLTLHPCKTAKILDTFCNRSKNPVVSWLSTVGPIVQLQLLPEYSRLT